jgi:hypothetical protein
VGLPVQAPGELEVPPRGASAELAGLTGVWAAVKCLVSVGASNVDLIKAHARRAVHAVVWVPALARVGMLTRSWRCA